MAEATQNDSNSSTIRVVLNTLTSILRRRNVFRGGYTYKGNRDIYQTLGYKRDLIYEDYKNRYERDGIASRIVNAFPAASWHNQPEIRERGKEDEEKKTVFEESWQSLVDRLNVYQVLERVDRLSSLGHYAVLMVGVRSQQDFSSPIRTVRSIDDVLYFSVYSEEHADIKSLVSNDRSPLFGLPSVYEIDFNRGNNDKALLPSLDLTGGNATGKTRVHASRVLHVAEDGLEDNIIGTPRLRGVMNYLEDLEKVRGGSAEMFWRDAKRRAVLSMAAEAEFTPEIENFINEEVDKFEHELKNFLQVQGMEVTPLHGATPTPSGHINSILDIIAGAVGIPKRMLTGSERGELASNQDESNWAQRIMERHLHFCEPNVLRPLIDLLIRINALPKPRQGYEVDWPNLCARAETEEAEVSELRSKAIATYAGTLSSPEEIVPHEVFLKEIMNFPHDIVTRIMNIVAEDIAEDERESSALEEDGADVEEEEPEEVGAEA